MGGHRYHVFLSHASADKPAVEELARWLVREGLTPFLDKWNLIPGENWIPALVNALAESETCAVFFGPDDRGGWQTEEVEQALIRRVQQRNRKAGDKFRTIPVLLPGASAPGDGEISAFNFLAANTWVRFEKVIDEDEPRHRLICGIKGIEPGDRQRGLVQAGECPYRDLNVFEFEHARLFFGREKLVHDLVEMLDLILRSRGPRLLAVVGPSGSGKSSIVRAGMMPVLSKGALGESASWRRLIFKPGHDPIENLGIALSTLPGGAGSLAETRDFLKIERFGHDDFRSLHTAARLAIRNDGDRNRVVVVVDQFEEVFTQCSSENDRRMLIENLLHAATDPDGPVLVVLSIRSDFLGACAGYRDLADAISGRQQLVGAMTENELRWAIEKPAALAGGEIETELVEQLLNDVGSDPGTLPLLEFVLSRLWREKTGRRMTAQDYRSLGGLRGALKHHADKILQTLRERGLEEICRRVFLDLIEPGKGTGDTRRRVDYRQLATSPEWTRVVETLINERLVTASDTEDAANGTIEIVHESLIKHWTTLHGWVDASRKNIETRTELEDAADRWMEENRHPDFLIGGLPLDNALAWAKDFPDDLARRARVREFLAESEASAKRRKQDALEVEKRLRENAEAAKLAEQKRAEAAEAQQNAERQRAEAATTAARELRKLSQRLRTSATVASVAGLVAGGLGWWAEVKRQSAEQAVEHEKLATAKAKTATKKAIAETDRANDATAIAESRRLAAVSESVMGERLDLAMLVALESTRRDTRESRLALERVHDHRPEISKFLTVPQGSVTCVAFGKDGRIAAGYGKGDIGGVAVFDADGSLLGASPLEVHEGYVRAIAYGPDGRLAAAYNGGSRAGVVIFDAHGARVRPAPLIVTEGRVSSVAYSSDGRLAVGHYTDHFDRGGVAVFDSRGERLSSDVYAVKNASVWSLVSFPDGRIAAGYGSGGTGGVAVFDARGELDNAARMEVKQGHVSNIALGPDGRLAAGYSGSDVAGVIVFGARGERLSEMRLEAKEGSVVSVSYGPDGRLAVGCWLFPSETGGVVVFDAHGARVNSAPLEVTEGQVTCAAYGPEGRLAAGYFRRGSVSSGVAVFDAHEARARPAPLEISEGSVTSVACASDGRIAAGYLPADVAHPRGVAFFDTRGIRATAPPPLAKHGAVTSVAYGPDGRLAVGYSNAFRGGISSVEVFDSRGAHAPPALLDVKQGFVSSVAYAPDGRLAAGYGLTAGGVVVLSASGDPGTAALLELNEASVTSVAYGPDGQLAAGYRSRSHHDSGGVVTFDSLGHRASPAPLEVKEGAVMSVAYGPDGRLAAGYATGVLHGTGGVVVFNSQGDRVSPAPLEVNEGNVSSVAYGPSAQLAAGYSGSVDGGVVVFDSNGERLSPAPHVLKGCRVTSVAYRPDGQLVAGYGDKKKGGIAFIDADPASWKRKVEQTVNRNFTQAEWKKYFPGSPYRRTIQSFPWPDDLSDEERKRADDAEKTPSDKNRPE